MSLKDDARQPGLLETALLAAAEKAITRALDQDPASRARLAKYAGRLLALELTFPPLKAYFLMVDDGVELYHNSEAPADVTLRGRPVDLAAHLLNWKSAPGLIGGSVEIRGDRELLQSLTDILRDLDIDWGGLLAPWMGDELAQQVDFTARRLWRWAGDAWRRLQQGTAEFLREDSDLLALRHEVYEFCQDVDELRMDVDRLEARVASLRKGSRPQPGGAS